MLGSIKSQLGAKNMIVEMGRDIFKGNTDVKACIAENLPSSYSFGVFVDVDVMLEVILIGHTKMYSCHKDGDIYKGHLIAGHSKLWSMRNLKLLGRDEDYPARTNRHCRKANLRDKSDEPSKQCKIKKCSYIVS
eukprot:1706531-Ditylum_brightwellii.AAC.1